MKTKIYNFDTANICLASIAHNLSLIGSNKYPINTSHFCGNPHRLVYMVLATLYNRGARTADLYQIETVINEKEDWKEIYEQTDCADLLEVILEIVPDSSNYEAAYSVLNKHALIRNLKKKGFDVSMFFDESEGIDYTDDYSVEEIISFYRSQISEVNTKYNGKYTRDEGLAGEDTRELIAQFKETPRFGFPFADSALTQIGLGWNKGQLILRSAVSGTGKTTISICELVNIGCSHIWSYDKEEFVPNIHYCGEHTMFSFTEMELRGEMQPKFLACVSGVNHFKIITGDLTMEEEERVAQAGEYLVESGIHLISMPDYTISGLREKVAQLKSEYNIAYWVHDYIEVNSALAGEFKDAKTVNRDDQILASVGTALKEIAEEFNIGVMSYTQTNSNVDQIEFLDASCIAGSKALRNKVDVGMVSIRAIDKAKQLSIAEKIISETGDGIEKRKPNIITYCYKGRQSVFDYKCKWFTVLDHSVCRMKNVLVLNAYNKQVNMDLNEYANPDFFPPNKKE